MAVLDSGYDKISGTANLCKSGHKDYTGETDPFRDYNRHGTNIASIISNVENKSYCVIILKVFAKDKSVYLGEAINDAIKLGVKAINFSGGGISSETKEFEAIKKALDKNIAIYVAAGNDGMNLGLVCFYYPACYKRLDPRLNVVGSLDNLGIKRMESNYGLDIVTEYRLGYQIVAGGVTMTGTSQATAMATKAYIERMLFNGLK